jgi:SSS family solute:Na+ symporter
MNSEDYLLGGRKMKSWPVGLSLFATLLSAISYLSTPGEMIKNGPLILFAVCAHPFTILFVGWFMIPFIMSLKVTSAYEILALRLGMSIRLLGSSIFLSLRLMWMAVIIFATISKVIVPLLGLDPRWTPWLCVVLGGVTVAYTSMGGLRAVVLTDVIQTLILMVGVILTLTTISISMGGILEWWPRVWAEHWQEPQWGFNTTSRVTVGWAVVSGFTWWLCTAGSDQMAIQRYLSTRDVNAARRSFVVSMITDGTVTISLGILGFALLSFFQSHPHLAADPNTFHSHADQLFPRFIVIGLPAGISGLVIAAILSAAMSSLSSGVNSSCSVITVDLLGRLRKFKSIDHLRLSRYVSVFVGTVVIGLTFFVSLVPGNLLEVAFRVVNLLVAPLFVLFFMAMFVPWARTFGTWVAEVCSITVAVLIGYWELLLGTPGPSFLWLMPGSLLVGIVVGLLASLIPLGPAPKPLALLNRK